MKAALAGVACILAACSGGAAPPEQQLADQCQVFTDAYNNAALSVRAGKLSQAQISTLVSLEPVSLMYCNPDAPPTDARAALQSLHDAVGKLQQIGATP